MKRPCFTIVSAAALLFLAGCTQNNGIRITELYCNDRISPVGIEGSPVFRWMLVATPETMNLAGWELSLETGEVVSEFSGTDGVEWIYDRPPLEPGTRYEWKVRLKDKKGRMSRWSREAWFVTGLPDAEWTDAEWIALEELPDSMKVVPAVHGSGDGLGDRCIRRPLIPQFRREFGITKKVEGAYLYISGLGHYTVSIDGQAPGDRFLTPGWTLYSKTCYYNGYDITDQLEPGSHVIGVTVGNGFFNVNRERYRKLAGAWGMPMMRMKLVIWYADGSSEELVSDEQWKTAASPVTYTSIYGGEDYDARLIQAGWGLTGFDDSKWKQVLVVKGPGGMMKCEEEYPMRIMQSFKPVKISEMPDGGYVYDFGQNASGIPEIRVSGAPGQTVRLTPGELIDDQGYITQAASGGPMYFEYTSAGKSAEIWEPSFSYYGFRYIGLSGAVPAGYPNPTGKPVADEIVFHHTRNSAPSAGSFRCSNELFNRIYNLIDWSVKSNLASVTTDCPHREKLGWLEVTHLMGTSIQYAYDIRNFYSKIVDDMVDSQLDNGLVPDIAPEYVPFEGGFRDSPEWGSSAVIIPWSLYQWYGDKRPMQKAWNMMTRYMEYLRGKSDQGILSHGLGDWCDLGPGNPGFSQLTPMALTATVIYYHDLDLLSQMAAILGKTDESKYYRNAADKVKEAFLARFYNPDTHEVGSGSQTSYAMPLVVGLIDPDKKQAVYDNLIKAIERDGYALTAGDVGFHYLVRALQDAGAHDVIWKMNTRDDVPGYGYQLKKGATALTESWPALRFVSNNHMMLGHLMEWFYSGIGGIRQAEGSVGYERIIIDPQPVGDLAWAEVTHQCIRGEIYVRWEKNETHTTGFELTIRIPAQCEARVKFGGKDIGVYKPGKHRIFLTASSGM